MKTLYLECNMGAAGDMLLGALYPLLPDQKGFLDTMNALGLPGVRLEAQTATSCGITGIHMAVTVDGVEEGHHHDDDHDHHHDHPGHDHADDDHDHHHHDHHHHSPAHIGALIDTLPLPEAVRTHAKAVYDAIAAAEAAAHGCPVGEVHFHEVGALDAVCDVAGVCYALHLLAADAIAASPVCTGFGQTCCAHGIIPVPAPATALLLQGIPSYGGNIEGELCTPTGAALLAHFATAFGPQPAMTTQRIGYGLGSKTFAAANCVRAFWGTAAEGGTHAITELVCNLDDMTPEALAYACTHFLEFGALDCYTTPATLKKGRAGQVLTVLCAPEDGDRLAREVFAHTSTNGLRVRSCEKRFLTPHTETVETPYGPIRVKCAQGYGTTHRKPEYADVAAAAAKADVPYDTVARAAEAALL